MASGLPEVANLQNGGSFFMNITIPALLLLVLAIYGGYWAGWNDNTRVCAESSATTEIEYRCYWWKIQE